MQCAGEGSAAEVDGADAAGGGAGDTSPRARGWRVWVPVGEEAVGIRGNV